MWRVGGKDRRRPGMFYWESSAILPAVLAINSRIQRCAGSAWNRSCHSSVNRNGGISIRARSECIFHCLIKILAVRSREAVGGVGDEVGGRDGEGGGGERRNPHGRPARQPSLSEQCVDHSQPLFFVKDRDVFRLGVLAQRDSSANLLVSGAGDADVPILPQQF